MEDEVPSYIRAIEERKRMIAGWRGRRLLACRATDDLEDIIAGLADDNGADLPPNGGFPPRPSAAQIMEMQNLATSLLRMILLWNDGNVSPQTLRRV